MSVRLSICAVGLGLATVLAGCATSTPYQPNVPGQATSGGFSEVRLESNRYRVNFQGNTMTSRETVEGYLLFRAAELTTQAGYDWFSVVDRDTDRQTRTYVEPDPLYRPYYGSIYGGWRPYWRYSARGYGWRTWDPFVGGPFWGDRVDVRTVDQFEASAEIVLGRGPKPADPRSFSAREVIDNLRDRIRLPGQS